MLERTWVTIQSDAAPRKEPLIPVRYNLRPDVSTDGVHSGPKPGKPALAQYELQRHVVFLPKQEGDPLLLPYFEGSKIKCKKAPATNYAPKYTMLPTIQHIQNRHEYGCKYAKKKQDFQAF